MKSTLLIFAALIGMAMASDGKSLLEPAEGRLFGADLFGILMTLVNLGVQIVILIALINLVHTLKENVDLEGLFSKDGGTGYDTGYYPEPDTGYGAPTGGHGDHGDSTYTSYRREGVARSSRALYDTPVFQRLSAKVNEAIEKFTE